MSKVVLFFHSHTGIGGTENNIIKISSDLDIKGYAVHFCCLGGGGDLYEKLEPFAKSKTILPDIKKQPLKLIKEYKKLVRTINPEVVLNFGLRVELFSRVFSKRFGVKRIISNIRSTDDWRKWYHTMLDKMTQKSVDAWVANSGAGLSKFQKRELIPKDKSQVIYNFIEAKSAKDKSRPSDRLSIGFLANIRPAKGHDLLVPIIKRLRKMNINVVFHLAGKDMMDGQLFRALKNENLEDYYIYEGFVKDTTAFINRMDFSVLLSRWEGLPTVLLESMIQYKPVIASRVGGVPEVITDEVDGLIIEPGSVEGIVGAIKKMSDVSFRNKLAKNGYTKVKQKFSKESIMPQWEEVISA